VIPSLETDTGASIASVGPGGWHHIYRDFSAIPVFSASKNTCSREVACIGFRFWASLA